MINKSGRVAIVLIAAYIGVLFFFVPERGAAARSRKSPAVGVVFFSSADCPHCRRIKYEIRRIQRRYPIKLMSFNIDNSKAYELFNKLESIHSTEGFGVPLVMVGDQILMGEPDIKKRLEPTVRRLLKSGGAPLPYLGPSVKKRRVRREPPARCPTCEKRPPTISEEWGKIRKFVDQFF